MNDPKQISTWGAVHTECPDCGSRDTECQTWHPPSPDRENYRHRCPACGYRWDTDFKVYGKDEPVDEDVPNDTDLCPPV